MREDNTKFPAPDAFTFLFYDFSHSRQEGSHVTGQNPYGVLGERTSRPFHGQSMRGPCNGRDARFQYAAKRATLPVSPPPALPQECKCG